MVMDRIKVIEQIEEKSCIAIVRGIEAKHCAALAQALYDGGISLIEVTFDQKDRDGWQQTLEGIRVIRDHLGDKVCVGAGTVMTKEQVTLAKGAGASFLISPHLDTELIRLTNEQGMVAIPGALTPTEVVQAWKAGAAFVKTFPADVGGPSFIRAVKAPLGHIPLLAVGGVNEKNVRSFLEAGACGVGIGGSLVNRQWILQNEFEKIRDLAEQIVIEIRAYKAGVIG